MNDVETDRLYNVLQSVHEGKLDGLPKYITDSTSNGLATLSDELIKTGFLNKKNFST